MTRLGAGDLYLSLRDPRRVPMTMLWHSNGGRDYAPWSGRHFGCLGVEEGAAEHMLGLSTEADLAGPGALTLRPDGIVEVRHVIGAIAWPSEEPVADVALEGGTVVVHGEGGARTRVPFRAAFLDGGHAGRPVVISAPAPRTLDLIFTPQALADLRARYERPRDGRGRSRSSPARGARARRATSSANRRSSEDRFLPGSKACAASSTSKATCCANMPYPRLFERGIHVVTTAQVFALPVAEIGLGFALDLLRDITEADLAFREGREVWGLDGNAAGAAPHGRGGRA